MKVDDVDAVKQIGAQVLSVVGNDSRIRTGSTLCADYQRANYEKYLTGIAY
jgi:hypothetical protein